MAVMPDGFDLDVLLAPIEGGTPVGQDLREDFTPQSYYYRLRDARAEARAAERAADAEGGEDTPPPQWRTVRDLASQALERLTKDLEIASWYTEAMVRSDGLVGLAAGAALINGLTQAFWDDGLYPLPDEDGISTRVTPITGLSGQGSDGTLSQPLRKISLFRRPSGDPLPYYQYKDAADVAGEANLARKQARLDGGSLVYDEVDKWARGIAPSHFAAQRERITAARDAWVEMSQTLDDKAGQDSPSTSRLRDLLDEIADAINRYAPLGEAQGGSAPQAGGSNAGAADLSGPASGGFTMAQGGSLAGPAQGASREDMLRELSRIADWFRKAEPASPLSYTIDDAVRRARLTLPELLAELLDDPSSRNAILSSLGIRPPVPDEE